LTGSPRTVAFFCATYLKPEMHHIHRQIHAVGNGWQAAVIAQKVENLPEFPVDRLEVVRRSPWRFLARGRERYLGGGPWQITQGEAGRVEAALKNAGADVLHVFFGNVAVHLLPLLERTRLPVVVSFHGADVTGAIASEAYREARVRMFARADAVACRSTALADAVAELGCAREKLVVMPTSLPEIPFHPRELPADGSLQLVQACRLIPKKGLATSLRAFAVLAQEFPRMTFTIAGTGPLEPELRALAHQLGIAGWVRFAGFLNQSALRELYASAHVFLHPSETAGSDVEGVPNALLEAAASGLPVVATRHGGIPEAIADGSEGLLVEEGDVAAVVAAVRRLVSDPALHARIANDGAAAVRAKFSAASASLRMAELYGRLAGG
jgi:Glycosyltransferase